MFVFENIYDVLKVEGNNPSSHWESFNRVAKWGLKTDPHAGKCGLLKEIRAFHEKLSREREDLAYEIDGIVIKVDDLTEQEKIGVRHRSPRWAFAWKFEPKQEVTRLEDIVVQEERTGMLTPVALLQPVDVGGVAVSRATLHNEEEIHRKDVRAGDKVQVVRAADVIPEVEKRIKEPGKKREKTFSMPRRFPACGSEISREGAYSFCPAGLSCPAQIRRNIAHFASQRGVDIEGLEGKTIVFTGRLEGYSRDEAKRLLEKLGGRATSSVSGETDMVVAGEDPGAKLEEATKRKVKVIDEKEFKRLTGQ